MYGTVARIQIKPGEEDRLREFQATYEAIEVPGFVSQYLYKMDKEANVYYIAVVFDSKAAYLANADSPEQDTRFHEFRALLTTDPEWHDGEIIYYASA